MNARPTPKELKQILAEHHAWCHNQGGKQADLAGADLRKANLAGANLTGANLTWSILMGANLAEADLPGSNISQVIGIPVAACHWTGHGEQGRLLNAIELPSGLHFYCGCFSGNEKELREYITNGDPNLIGSRTRALDFLLGCF